MLQKIDKVLLDLCTRLSHWCQRNIGITNFFFAKIGIGLVGVHLLVRIANYLHQFLRRPTGMITTFICCIILYTVYRRSEASAEIFFSTGFTIFYYFIAVQPLPPGKSRVRQWIEGLGILKPALASAEN